MTDGATDALSTRPALMLAESAFQVQICDFGRKGYIDSGRKTRPIRPQKCASAFVLLFLIGVLRTIKFDDQVRFQANEIDEERPN